MLRCTLIVVVPVCVDTTHCGKPSRGTEPKSPHSNTEGYRSTPSPGLCLELDKLQQQQQTTHTCANYAWPLWETNNTTTMKTQTSRIRAARCCPSDDPRICRNMLARIFVAIDCPCARCLSLGSSGHSRIVTTLVSSTLRHM